MGKLGVLKEVFELFIIKRMFYMFPIIVLLVAQVKKPDKIPAVTHVDGTGRLKTVSKKSNPLYYDLTNEFYKLTGVPVIVNTSMNVKGEPIVNTPSQGYTMLRKTEMDYIVMGNFLISKGES